MFQATYKEFRYLVHQNHTTFLQFSVVYVSVFKANRLCSEERISFVFLHSV